MKLTPIDFLRRGIPWLGVCSLLLGLLLLGWQATRSWTALKEWQAAQRAAAHGGQADSPKRRATAQSQAERAELDSATVRLAVPWGTWLAVLESHADGTAIVRRIEQDGATGVLKVSAQAAGSDEMLAYLGRMQTDARLTQVQLLSQQINRALPDAPTEFEWSARAIATPLAATAPTSP